MHAYTLLSWFVLGMILAGGAVAMWVDVTAGMLVIAAGIFLDGVVRLCVYGTPGPPYGVRLEWTPETEARLVEIRRRTGLADNRLVVNRALALYEYVVDRVVDDAAELVVRTPDGQELVVTDPLGV